MKNGSKLGLIRKLLAAALVFPMMIAASSGGFAAPLYEAEGPAQKANTKAGRVQLEYLDRGIVSASTSEGIFLSWRLLAGEVTGYGDQGLTPVSIVFAKKPLPDSDYF